MNTTTADAIKPGSFKKVMVGLPAEDGAHLADRDRLKAALAFLFLRYAGMEKPVLPFLQAGQWTRRRWQIGDGTSLHDLVNQFRDSSGIPVSNPLELSAWNPACIHCADREAIEDLLRKAPAAPFQPDLLFIACEGERPALRIWSAHEGHDPAFLRQMLAHWLHAMRLLERSPRQPVLSLPILTKEEYDRIIHQWNDTDRPSEDGKFDFEEFDLRVEQVPGKVAISQGGVKLTYRQLQEKANRMGHYLQSLGVGPEVVVGICLPRSIDFVVALVGLIKSGGAFLPLDPAHPDDRKRYMIQNAGAAFVITSRDKRKSLPEGDYQTILLDDIAARLESFPTHTPDHGLKAGNMAYLFFTSGSTGQPKGVQMVHTFQDKKDPSEDSPIKDEKVLLKSSTGFTVILLETFSAIKAGGEIVVVPEGREKDTGWLIEKIKEERIETINMVPSLLSLLLQEGLGECASLKKVFTIGERLPVAVQKEFFQKMPQARLYVFYGCTEAPSATFREILPEEDYGDRVILGKAQNNKKIYILDKFKVPVPAGVPGEIFIGGHISRGYAQNQSLTVERFLPDPFTGKPGDRMYQTGDLGRFLEDGSVEYLGRTDFQVQIRGIRVEPAEVDIRVTEHPAIKECVTIAREDANGDNRLISYYVLNQQSSPPDETELARFVRERLPEYLMPAAFVPIDRIPLLLNGKIDRNSLPQLEIVGSRKSREAQGSDLEKKLTVLWEEILDARRVGRRDNFFDLGGNSLKVLRLCHRIKIDLGKTISVAEVYANPTILALAEILQQEKHGDRFTQFFGGVGTQTPVFFMPGISRNALVFTPLAELLKEDRPCYGIELPGMENGVEPLGTIEEMAVHCIAELKRVRPVGPYFLAGYSFGGLLAFETARQLGESGGEHCKVVLFDTRLNKPRTYTWLDRLRWFFKMMAKEPVFYPAYILRELVFHALTFMGLGKYLEKYRGIDEDWQNINAISPGIFNRTYEPKPCDAPVLLFTARDTEISITSAQDLENWKNACTADVRTCRINTNYHVTVLKPKHLEFIREKVNEFLRD